MNYYLIITFGVLFLQKYRYEGTRINTILYIFTEILIIINIFYLKSSSFAFLIFL